MPTSQDISKKEQALSDILTQMDVPPRRIDMKDWRWMARNLKIENGDHPLLDTALELVRQILRYQAREGVNKEEGLKYRPFAKLKIQ